ncbi:tyrosine-protein phosphatase [Cognatishimia sp. SS12]|uniref:phosphatase domain-containing putative toxin n=1 Tax=Cognatishimia sp. SS12 TaxID=2979465 RepID=UPI002330FB30|nr:tyrosine-protein phosphatase [Cognatishimia sp. SS12]MDC0739213.1 tyrosine-protein phosphatase [Cognatishimia sp. SS12]
MAKPGIQARLKEWERSVMRRYNVPADSPENIRRAQFYNRWLDHGILRVHWTNLDEFSPGAWRSNNPTPARFRKLPDMGIKTVLNVRGGMDSPIYREEVALCEELGLTLITLPMASREAPKAEVILELLEIFDTIEHPFLMHCKSGADRTGLASAIYLMTQKGVAPRDTFPMLSFKYLHLKSTRTGVLDRFLMSYTQRYEETGINFADWVREHYDAEKLQADFNAKGLKDIT